MAKTSRRLFLGFGGSLILLSAGSVLACRSGVKEVQENAQALYDRLDVLLSDLVDPIRIGRASRSEMGLDRLLAQAQGNSSIREIITHDCPATRRAIWRERIRSDFQSGNIVLRDRFIVSTSESIVAGLRFDAIPV